ncbi:hypothetical protein D3C76_1333650 [compost metagenome]
MQKSYSDGAHIELGTGAKSNPCNDSVRKQNEGYGTTEYNGLTNDESTPAMPGCNSIMDRFCIEIATNKYTCDHSTKNADHVYIREHESDSGHAGLDLALWYPIRHHHHKQGTCSGDSD